MFNLCGDVKNDSYNKNNHTTDKPRIEQSGKKKKSTVFKTQQHHFCNHNLLVS